MHVLFVGEPDDGVSVSSHHARALAQCGCRAAFVAGTDSLPACDGVEAVHLITREQTDGRLAARILEARQAGIPVLRFWTGRDLLWAKHHDATRRVAIAFAEAGVRQICRDEEAADQLREWGIEGTILPMLSMNVSNATPPQPLPQQFTVLCHLPPDRREYCGSDLIDSLIRWLPRVRFLILGGERERYANLRNVEPLGRVEDVVRSIQRATVTIHARLDATPSRLMLETLALGRHVIANCPWPNCTLVNGVDEFLGALRNLQRDVSFHLAGREEVCRTNDVRTATEALLKALRSARGDRGEDGRAAARSGLAALAEVDFAPPDPRSLPEDAHALRALVAPTLPQPLVASV